MRSILFYVSGHGYGHAVRAGEVMRALQALRPDWRILVRSQAPARMFPPGVEFSEAEVDCGVVEREAGVVIDEAQTLRRLVAFLERWDELVAAEVAFVRREAVDLIVADIPPMAGDNAFAAGVPCIAISNFTWDWIYEPYAAAHLQRLEAAYARMQTLLRLPFFQPTRLDRFPRIVDAPLIARRSEVRPESGTRVLLGSRAEIPAEALARASAEGPEFEFVTPRPDVPFPEQFAACGMVIAKLGFSMLAECIVGRKPLLYPPREGFREETLLQAHVHCHLPAIPIPLEDFYAGNWAAHLRKLGALPKVDTAIRLDGAEFCARFLGSWWTPATIADARLSTHTKQELPK